LSKKCVETLGGSRRKRGSVMRTVLLPVIATFLVMEILATAAPRSEQSPAQGGPAFTTGVLKTQETNIAGVIADVVECKRKDGVLSIRVRLRNTSSDAVLVKLISGRNFDTYYVTAGSKKYFVLRDEEKVPLAASANQLGDLNVQIPKGGAWTWWAKYPAPPDSESKINYITPFAAPFEDVPIGS
jgi:hypothetical protein